MGDILKQVAKCENDLSDMFLRLYDLRQKIHFLGGIEMEQTKETKVPLVAQEMILDRLLEERTESEKIHAEERKEMRESHKKELENTVKHCKTIVKWVCGAFLAFVFLVFAGVIWFFSNYELASYTQDGDGLNNMANYTTQGDVTYGAEAENFKEQEKNQP